MNFYIWGAGNNLNCVYDSICGNLDINGIIDNDSDKVGNKYKSYTILNANEFIEKEFKPKRDCIIVSVTKPRYVSE